MPFSVMPSSINDQHLQTSLEDSLMSIGIKGIAYTFDRLRDISTLPALAQDEEMLAGFVQGGHRSFGCSDCSLSEQAARAALRTLTEAGIRGSQLDAVVVGCASIRFWHRTAELLSTEIMLALELKDIPVFGVTMGGCANYSTALRIAKGLLVENGWRNVLLIETNKVASDETRPYMPYVSIFGDGCVSAVISTVDPEYKISSIAHITKPLDAEYGGDPRFVTNNINGYRRVIGQALEQARCTMEDIDAVIPNNKNIAELQKLAVFWKVPFKKVFTANVARIGHLWSADNLINLKDLCVAENALNHNTFLLLCQGDATYSAIVLERTSAAG